MDSRIFLAEFLGEGCVLVEVVTLCWWVTVCLGSSYCYQYCHHLNTLVCAVITLVGQTVQDSCGDAAALCPYACPAVAVALVIYIITHHFLFI